jgi:hypothetical protein
MIAHVSIPAAVPQKTAQLLGQLIGGKVFSFPVVPGAFIVVANDRSGTAIEVYPQGMVHHPGSGEAPLSPGPATMQTQAWEDQIYMDPIKPDLSSHHMAIVTRLSEQQVMELGKQHGLRTVPCDRAGVFKLVELWIDQNYLIEVLIETEAQRYRDFMNPETAAKLFGAPIQ